MKAKCYFKPKAIEVDPEAISQFANDIFKEIGGIKIESVDSEGIVASHGGATRKVAHSDDEFYTARLLSFAFYPDPSQHRQNPKWLLG